MDLQSARLLSNSFDPPNIAHHKETERMPTEEEIEAGARALAGQKMHPTRITEKHVTPYRETARLVLVAAEAARVSARERERI